MWRAHDWKIGGQRPDDVLGMPIYLSVRHRLPWLMVGLFGGLLAAQVVKNHEDVLQQNLILAIFIPLIAYMNGAVGAQMGAFVIRDFAIDAKINVKAYIWRQFKVVALLAIAVCAVLFAAIDILYADYLVAGAVAIALFVAMLSSVFTGTLIPLMFDVFDLDPANGSGPVATVVQDLLSVLIYFSVASWLLV